MLDLLAATTETLPGLPAPAQYGILGIAVAVLATGKILVPTGWLKDEREARLRAEARADRYEAEVKRLNDSFAEKAIPALIKGAEAMTEIQTATKDLLDNVRRGGR